MAVVKTVTVAVAQTMNTSATSPTSRPVVINGVKFSGSPPIPSVIICSIGYVVRVMLVGAVAESKVSVNALVTPLGFLTVTVVLDTAFSVRNC